MGKVDLNKKQKKELMCKKVVDNFSSLSSNIEGINNEMKNLTDKLNKLSDIFWCKKVIEMKGRLEHSLQIEKNM